jgi:hypothetical protein
MGLRVSVIRAIGIGRVHKRPRSSVTLVTLDVVYQTLSIAVPRYPR